IDRRGPLPAEWHQTVPPDLEAPRSWRRGRGALHPSPLSLSLLGGDRHMDPLSGANTMATELGRQLSVVAGDGQVPFGDVGSAPRSYVHPIQPLATRRSLPSRTAR